MFDKILATCMYTFMIVMFTIIVYLVNMVNPIAIFIYELPLILLIYILMVLGIKRAWEY